MTQPQEIGWLARAAQSGDRRAFEQLVRLHKDSLYRFVRRYVGNADDAYDVVQDAFVSAWLGLRTLDPAQPFAAWLRAIALNKCRDRGRRNAVRQRFLALFGIEAQPQADLGDDDPQQQLEQRLLRLDREISNLPRQYKEPLLLTLHDGMTQQQVARQLGTSTKAVELRIRRARQRLAAALGEAQAGAPHEG